MNIRPKKTAPFTDVSGKPVIEGDKIVATVGWAGQVILDPVFGWGVDCGHGWMPLQGRFELMEMAS